MDPSNKVEECPPLYPHLKSVYQAYLTLAAMRQGTYPYSKSIYLARGPKLSPVAQGFLEFILSASGKEILDRAGYVPASSQP